MPMMVSRRRLDEGDFDAWMERFEAQCPARAAAGCRGVRRFRGIDDPRELVVIFDWEDRARGEAFVAGKIAEKPELLDQREDGPVAGAKLENSYMEELPPLPS